MALKRESPGLQDDVDFLVSRTKEARTDGCRRRELLPRVALLATGTFNPPHRGHIEMLRSARDALEGKAIVVGSIMVPSSDTYLLEKVRGAGLPDSVVLRFEERVQLLRKLAGELGESCIHFSDAQQNRGQFYCEIARELAMAGKQVFDPFPVFVFVSGSDRWKPLCTDNDDIAGVVIVERRGQLVPPRETWEQKFRDDPWRIVIPAAANTAGFSSTDLLKAVRAAVAEAAGPYMGTEAASLYAGLYVNNTDAVIESASGHGHS